MHHHHRAGCRSIERKGLQPDFFIKLDFILDDLHLELDDLWTGGCHLLVRVNKGRCCKL